MLQKADLLRAVSQCEAGRRRHAIRQCRVWRSTARMGQSNRRPEGRHHRPISPVNSTGSPQNAFTMAVSWPWRWRWAARLLRPLT